MALYFFDTRDNDVLITDDVGVELPDLDAVKVQAAKGLAELALDVLPGSMECTLGIDVRAESGEPIMINELIFKARVLVDLSG